jgi:predicted oxidoreductase
MKDQKLQLSPIVAGCMKWGQWGAAFSTTQYRNMISNCVDNNITSFDHADIYGHYTTEEEFGNTLKELKSIRLKMQLITKCGIKMLSPNRPQHTIKSYDTGKQYIIDCVENSLTKLHTDYIDLFLIHRPDPLMNPEEIAAAFLQLKQEGKVLHVGVSNFSPSQVLLLHKLFPVEVNQLEISILQTDPFFNGQLDQCRTENIIPMAWGPLGSGLLQDDTMNERNLAIINTANQLAKKYNTTVENILLAFLSKHPAGIIPVLGTSKIERLQSAMQYMQIELEREDWFLLLQSSRGHEVA